MAFLPDVRWWTILLASLLLNGTIAIGNTTLNPKILCPQICQCLSSMVACNRLRLRQVPSDLPDWTTSLELQTNKISYLGPNSLRHLVHLESLDLSNNRLRNISDGAFAGLEKLRKLKIYRNKLTSFPAIANKLTALVELSIHHNLIQNISASDLEGLGNLTKLDLSSNKISSLTPGVFVPVSGLLELNLEGNRLSEIRAAVLANLTLLRVLKLGKNSINSLEVFPSLPHLRVLNLDHNNLRQISSLTFQMLMSLEELSIRHNEVVRLMDGVFYGLRSIRSLDLSWNAIPTVSQAWLYGLENLRELSLGHNHINGTDSWKFCTSLERMNLSSNRLELLEADGLTDLSNLRALFMDNNRIADIQDGAFRGLRGLQTLVLSDNLISWQIEDMAGAFEGLEAVQALDMSNNNLRFLPVGAFQGLESLRKLDVRGNDIASIQENPFEDSSDLQELFLNTSSLYCDCQVAWFPDWVREMDLTQEVAATCSHPESLLGRDVFQVERSSLQCVERPQPYIVKQPVTVIALKGDNVSLVCIAATTSDTDFEVTWKKDNRPLLDANPLNVKGRDPGKTIQFTSVLSLPNIDNSKEGRYQCVFTNKFGTAYTKKAKVTVNIFPSFTKIPSNVKAKVGTMARLECSATGHPIPEISWEKDGGLEIPAALDRRFHVLPGSDSFFIVDLQPKDMGVYTCTATNQAGTILSNATLTVLQDPYLEKPLADQEVQVGDAAILECQAGGSPAPTIHWSKDAKPFEPSNRHRLPVEDGGRFLIVMEVTMDDGGEYACNASNSESFVIGKATLTVTTEGAFPLSVTTTSGIIIIAVVLCIVGTSIIWVIVIYQTRKLRRRYALPPSADNTSLPAEIPSTSLNGSSEGTIHQETSSGVSSEATDKYQQENSDCDSMDDLTRGDHLGFPHHGRSAAIFPSEMGIVDPPEYNMICSLRVPDDCSGEAHLHQLPVEIRQGSNYPSEYSCNSTIPAVAAPGEDQPFLEISELARRRHLSSDQEDYPMHTIQVTRPSETDLRLGNRSDQLSVSSVNTCPPMRVNDHPWRAYGSAEDTLPYSRPAQKYPPYMEHRTPKDCLKPPSPHKHRTKKPGASPERPPVARSGSEQLQSKKCPSHRKMDSGRRIAGRTHQPHHPTPQSSLSTSQLPISSPSTSLDVQAFPYRSLQKLSTSTEV